MDSSQGPSRSPPSPDYLPASDLCPTALPGAGLEPPRPGPRAVRMEVSPASGRQHPVGVAGE